MELIRTPVHESETIVLKERERFLHKVKKIRALGRPVEANKMFLVRKGNQEDKKKTRSIATKTQDAVGAPGSTDINQSMTGTIFN